MRVASLNQDAGIGVGAQKGASVHVESMRQAMSELGADVISIDEKSLALAKSELERVHRLERIDLVYERYSLRAGVGADFSRKHDVPFVLEVNAPLLVEAEVQRGRKSAAEDLTFEQAVFESALSIITVSNPVAEYVRRHGIPAERVLVRPNAVDAKRFAPLTDRDAARRELDLEHRFVLGFHGRLRPWHGFERIAAVAARLLADGIPVHVLTLGAGDFAGVLAKLLPPSAFTCLPWTKHELVPRTVGCFDALALGYSADTLCYFSPLKLLEAMAVGAVPVVPEAGDLTGIVKHAVNGLVYRPGDDEMLFRALESLALHPALRTRLAQQALVSARAHSWKSLAYEVLGFAMRAPQSR